MRRIGIVLVVVALLGAMGIASLQSGGDGSRRERLERFVAEHARARKTVPAPAPAPRLSVVPACAQVLQRLPRGVELVGDTSASAFARAAVWPELAPFVRMLRDEIAQLPVGADAGVDEEGVWSRVDALLGVAWWRTRDCGSDVEAVGLQLDRVQLWIGYVQARQRHGRSFVQQSWWEHGPERVIERLGASTLARLDERLERLDAAWPSTRDVAAVLANSAQAHLLFGHSFRPMFGFGGVRHRLAAWRHGFDPDRREFAALDAFVAVLPCLVPAAGCWPQRDAQWSAFFRAGPPEWTGVASYMDLLRNQERTMFEELARLRLLRLAVRYRLGGPQLELPDPFAPRPLSIEEFADHARVRSLATHARIERVVWR